MKVTAINLRPGNVIEYNDKLWVVLKQESVHPGKGNSVSQVEMRDLVSGNKDNVRFRTQETLVRVRLDQDPYQFLYLDGDDYHFMNNESFEQITISNDVIGDQAVWLQEGMEVTVEAHEGNPLRVELPDTVAMEVIEAEPVVKGQTASSSYKPAIVENNEKVMVPPHIETGTRIVIKVEDGSYVERAKD